MDLILDCLERLADYGGNDEPLASENALPMKQSESVDNTINDHCSRLQDSI